MIIWKTNVFSYEKQTLSDGYTVLSFLVSLEAIVFNLSDKLVF